MLSPLAGVELVPRLAGVDVGPCRVGRLRLTSKTPLPATAQLLLNPLAHVHGISLLYTTVLVAPASWRLLEVLGLGSTWAGTS